jgi:hypothetical protein
MTDQNRATPEQWADLGAFASDTRACILELRARIKALQADQLEQAESQRFCVDAIVRRIEALEAAPQDKLDRLIALDAADPTPDPAMPELRAASAEAQPAGGLVERVAARIEFGIDARQDPEGIARAAIREVAAAAKDLRFTTAKALIDWLERESGIQAREVRRG